jgi:orotate phosphoribosyltransferase
MKMPSAKAAVDAGLLRFPPAGTLFPGRELDPLPFLIDSRGAGADLRLRRLILRGLRTLANTAQPFDVIAGLSKAGTIWGAWLAWAERCPYATVHPDGARRSGLQRAVEGHVESQRVLLVDNWVRSGKSVREAIAQVVESRGLPVGVLAIVTSSEASFEIPLHAVWTTNDLLSAARDCPERESRP